jgi:hypothetical protein
MSEEELLSLIRSLRDQNAAMFGKLQTARRLAKELEVERDGWRDVATTAMKALERTKERTAKLVQRLRDRR